MINFIIWWAAFLCPNPNHTPLHHGACNMVHINTTSSSPDTGGETGGTPKPPVPPPPPPTGSGN